MIVHNIKDVGRDGVETYCCSGPTGLGGPNIVPNTLADRPSDLGVVIVDFGSVRTEEATELATGARCTLRVDV